MFPTRYTNLEAARRRFGDRVDRLGRFLWKGDPLADEAVEALSALPYKQAQVLIERGLREGIETVPDAPEALRRFFAAVEHVPFWVDWKALDRGGAAFLRTGAFGGLVLSCYSLVMGYCSPGGNKPLTFTGRLTEAAPRRLSETSHFVLETCRPGGLRRSSEGFAITVKVRLMHSHVRRMIKKSGRWDAGAYGEPANQHDMVGTLLLFSVIALDGLRKFGFRFSEEESESLMHLWRYSGYLMGVEPELLPTSEREGRELGELLEATAGLPDEDSRALAQALMEAPLTEAREKNTMDLERAKRVSSFVYGVSRALIGDERAAQLGYPKSAWRFSVPALRGLVTRAEQLRRVLPGSVYNLASAAGIRYWGWIVETGLAGVPAEFRIPQEPVALSR